MVGHTFLYHSAVRAIRSFIQEGQLGKIHYISMQRLNLGLFQKDINVLWDLAPHDISILHYLLDEPPIEVAAQGKASIHPHIEDVAMLTLRFASGILAYIHVSWLDPRKTRQATIVGDRKMLVYNDISPTEKIEIYDKGVETPPHYDTFAEFQYAYRYGEKISPYIEEEEPLKVQSRHFLDCIQQGTTPLSGPQNGGLVVRVLQASDESIAQGGRFVKTELD
jgi:predicted dehydrogenase